MKLFEYQAREVFAEFGIPVPLACLVNDLDAIPSAIEKIGVPCVIKAQVLHGGRGKAGLIKFGRTKDEAQRLAVDLLQNRPGVGALLVTEMISVAKELYVSITVDPSSARFMVIACADGGVEIEILAKENPGAIEHAYFDPDFGLQPFKMRSLAYRLGLASDQISQFVSILNAMALIFDQYDAELVEINPLFITKEGKLVAGDAKLMIDDNAAFRQKRFSLTREHFTSDMEFEAAQEGIPYLQFDGDISLMCAGAGLTTVVYDLVNYEGGSVANYLEFGGPNYKKALRAMELCLQNPSKVILVVTFGTIARADVMAQGLVDAMQALKPDRPIVACIRGTNEEEAVRILKSAGLDPVFDTEEAVRKAVAICKEA